eukprot:CAMPEP_0201551336 /NCGR_PEP_ID=MMETSP0173_2-20130828/7529_1 /ASSEMBLY_ACC=CAM_ASM_000268 /TAXON_ID=218659 /ORGANISM="Vexillifera sp., Strain DIVA3 564/2" /LENGTH=481 /DNA_ID=CAMNT_0047961553 /DNA_START=1 /DNA_END=1443 /DNA_ORIENTATION=+
MLGFLESFLPKGNDLTTTTQSALEKVLLGVQRSLSFIALTTGTKSHQLAPSSDVWASSSQKNASSLDRNATYPILIFDSFHEFVYAMEKTRPASDGDTKRLVNTMLKWATLISQKYHTAHVVFVTDSLQPDDIVRTYVPAQSSLRVYQVNDLNDQDAFEYLASNLIEFMQKAARCSSSISPQSQSDTEKEGFQSWYRILVGVIKARTFQRMNSKALADNQSHTKNVGEHHQSLDTTQSSDNDEQPILSKSEKFFNSKEKILNYIQHNSNGVCQQDESIPLPDFMFDQCQNAVEKLGGRLSDLKALGVRVYHGTPIPEAVESMIEDCETELILRGFSGQPHTAAPANQPWTNVQLWKTIKLLVSNGKLKLTDLSHNVFEGSTSQIYEMVKAGILTLERKVDAQDGSVEYFVKPGSTKLATTFKRLTTTKQRFVFEKCQVNAAIASCLANMEVVENELKKLSIALGNQTTMKKGGMEMRRKAL